MGGKEFCGFSDIIVFSIYVIFPDILVNPFQ